jgi:hypothetical protein
MSQEFGGALAITLNDGRTIVATPRPEDQGRIAELADGPFAIRPDSSGSDTSGHAISDELTVDVEGHAMTLRLPTPADAEALRKALAVGVVTATIVAAGAIAAMQGSPATTGTTTQTVSRPAPAPAAEDFQTRREREIDRMLEAPPAEMPGTGTPSNNRVGGPQE